MRLLTAAAVTLLASSAAFAQPMMGGPGGERPMGMMGMMGGHCAMMKRPEGALAFLKTELKITAAQEQVWGAFAGAFRDASDDGHDDHHGDGPKGHRGDHGQGHGNDMPFPEKAQHHLEMMDAHHTGFKKMYDAATPLYKALSAEQRKTADELLMPYLMSHHCGMM